jgi:ribose-phosphate pyrophosphokinase
MTSRFYTFVRSPLKKLIIAYKLQVRKARYMKRMDYFIAGLNERALAGEICRTVKGTLLKHEISVFTGGEIKLKLENKNLKGGTVYIVQSVFANANDNLMELFLLADAVRGLGCKNITAVIPYLGYARQDKAGKGEARSFQCVINLIKASGIKEVVTVDLHNPKAIRTLGFPITNLGTTEIFKKVVKGKTNAVIVAPDAGAINRAKALSEALDVKLVVVKKERVGSKVKVIEAPQIKAVEGKDCYLMDDIIDTGNTICAVASELARFSPKSITALASHGLFGKGALQAIQKSCIQKVYVTDSVAHEKLDCPKIQVLKVSPIISNYLKNA